ncbi:VOC family protein [Duncaniella muris]|uniref:VOC family protein n=1 Tax=Duncaniella muris TaxID=2094150 RepID=UPI00272A4D64|nr:VOC family protein [Duncaniella muris]
MAAKFNFNTIGLFTTDNTRMVAFYRDIMGFETDWNGEDPDVRMQLGNMWLILFPRTAFEQMTGREYSYPCGLNGTVELAFYVPTFSDVDEEYARVTALGAKSVFDALGATHLLYCRPRREPD